MSFKQQFGIQRNCYLLNSGFKLFGEGGAKNSKNHAYVVCERSQTLISEGHSESRGGRFKCQKPKEAFENYNDDDE